MKGLDLLHRSTKVLEERYFWNPRPGSLRGPYPRCHSQVTDGFIPLRTTHTHTLSTYRGTAGTLRSWQTWLSCFALRIKKKRRTWRQHLQDLPVLICRSFTASYFHQPVSAPCQPYPLVLWSILVHRNLHCVALPIMFLVFLGQRWLHRFHLWNTHSWCPFLSLEGFWSAWEILYTPKLETALYLLTKPPRGSWWRLHGTNGDLRLKEVMVSLS